jgi:hypothetical protein
MKNLNNVNIYTNEEILSLPVTQEQYDALSVNRKSTFINLFDSNGEYVVSVNTLDMKGGSDYLFLSEVLRAAETAGLVPVNSLVSYKGLTFRLSAVQTTELQTGLKMNVAKKEDFKKAPSAPVQPVQQQPIQQPMF